MNEQYTTQIFAGFRCPSCQHVMRNFQAYMQCENTDCELYLARWNHIKLAITLYNEDMKKEEEA